MPLEGEMKKAAEKKLFDLIDGLHPNAKEIKDLINDGVDINCRNEKGMTPLLRLMEVSNDKINLKEIVLLLIELGANVRAKNNWRSTALQYLCQFYEQDDIIEIIEILIENGVDVDVRNNFSLSALNYCCENKNYDLLFTIKQFLIANGASDIGDYGHCYG